jgi:FKBP-type peptidyl-prolyl cis-trans isomerase 2
MKAKKGDKVKVHYTIKLDNGEIVETTDGFVPVDITIGKYRMIPELENRIIGMRTGESRSVKIPSEKAYGNHEKRKVIELSRDRMPQAFEPQIGQHVRMFRPDGKSFVVTVIDITEKGYKIDANHPLAGKDIICDLRLLDILNSS